jgi:ferritin-like metal-binding protein YciE
VDRVVEWRAVWTNAIHTSTRSAHMSLETLADLYLEELKDLYSAENQILKALPKMIKAATNAELKQAFTDHLEQTKGHVARLEEVCDDLGKSPKGKKCMGMEGVIKDGAELIEEGPEADVLDAGLASAAQHVEHYEMAGYGSVRAWAEQLGFENHVELLQQTLDEEKEADRLLTQIAESSLNAQAENEEEEETGGLADARPRSKRSAAKQSSSRTRSKPEAEAR